jgi:hypothetical protein
MTAGTTPRQGKTTRLRLVHDDSRRDTRSQHARIFLTVNFVNAINPIRWINGLNEING